MKAGGGSIFTFKFKRNTNTNRKPLSTRKRLGIIKLTILGLFIVVTANLVKPLYIYKEKLTAMHNAQERVTQDLEYYRGEILDRSGKELAISYNGYKVDVDLKSLRESLDKNKISIEDFSKKISNYINKSYDDIYSLLSDTSENAAMFFTLARKIDYDNIKLFKSYLDDSDVVGVTFDNDTKRFYPYNDLASKIIGHINSEGIGLVGVENMYNKFLTGINGSNVVEKDALGNTLPYDDPQYFSAVNGKNVTLTLDLDIQNCLEKHVKEAMTNTKSKGAAAIVCDPYTGEILAMASTPGYNLNDPWIKDATIDVQQKAWNNPCVSNAFELGSIMKIATSLAALEDGTLKDVNDIVSGGGKTLVVNGKPIANAEYKDYGVETLQDALVHSSNIAFAALGLKIGADRMEYYLNKFGFGKPTGVDLPSETAGIIKDAKNMIDLDLATIAFGQTNSASMIQYMAFLNAVANGGTWLTPHVLKEYTDTTDNTTVKYEEKNAKQIISKESINKLMPALVKTVENGKARTEGLSIAGKTGTAQVASTDSKGYVSTKYNTSFVAIFPGDAPKYTLMVSVFEPDPEKYYAGDTAVPPAKAIIDDLRVMKNF